VASGLASAIGKTASPGVPPQIGVPGGALLALSSLIVAEAPRLIVGLGMRPAASDIPVAPVS